MKKKKIVMVLKMIQEFNKLLNNLFKKLNRNYAKASSKREIDIAYADAQLQLIKKIIDKMEEEK